MQNIVTGAVQDRCDLATVAATAVWASAVTVAVNQLGIATTLIDTLLAGVVGVLAMASGLAFGPGGREQAASLIGRWSRDARDAAPKLVRAAADASAAADGAGASIRVDRTTPR